MVDNVKASTSAQKSGVLSDTVLDGVQVELEAFVGRAKITIAELKRLRQGDALALATQLNQAIELRLNGQVIARGEVVAVGDNFGVRLTEIVS
ncbi:FliM/FliN family flagellar motor switch protein [Novosphingobium fuchskuhlense]|uniref:FliM/FliN family flagellar motor switch protein n=1 Tax=Novosphingobium fuchskuhlense TaxID=1117702 RepID=UPI000AED6ACC|nr:FliM/FliN family flagellar motor switch protein [Novosphingobium fuchskuhlense]